MAWWKLTRLDDFEKNICLVCRLERADFEKKGLNFEQHQRQDHDIWKYLNYLIYLDKKPEDEFDGNEIFVWENFLEKKVSWIPQNRTVFLGKQR